MPDDIAPPVPSRSKRLADSAYLSPYSHVGALKPHPNTDPYAALRARVLTTLKAMGYDPKTKAECGVVWARDQDPFGPAVPPPPIFPGLSTERS